MTEARSRREPTARTRTRTKTDAADGAAPGEEERTTVLTEAEPEGEPTGAEPAAEADASAASASGRREPADEVNQPAHAGRSPAAPPDDGPYGFDEEINNRYEEIKRGSTHISRAAADDHAAAPEGRQGRGADRVHRPQEAGPDLQDPQGARQAERPDVRRRHAGSAARRLRLPAQPRLQLPALPRRHLHFAVADSPLRPAHRRRRGRPDPPAQGERALLRPAARRGHQLPGSRTS